MTRFHRCALLLAVVAPGVLVLAAPAVAQAPAGGTPSGGAFQGQYAPPPADRKFPAWPKGCVRF